MTSAEEARGPLGIARARSLVYKATVHWSGGRWPAPRNRTFNVTGEGHDHTRDLQLLCIASLSVAWVPCFVAVAGAAFDTDGAPVCTDPDLQYPFSIVTDGSQGAIVVWNDSRGRASTSTPSA
jgi:hypothetical protein